MALKDLNLEQQRAVTYGEGPVLIVAGAGTGKTSVITERVAWLIENKLAQADEILALTFTDKAAGEMEERIDKLLPYGYVDLWVMTFHGFCERMLTNHALDIGIANNFRLLNQTEQWMLVRENLDKFNLDYYRPLGNPTKFIHALLKHFSRCKDEEIWPEDYLKYAEELKMNLDEMESTGGKSKVKNRKSKVESDGKDNLDNAEISRLEEIANAYHTYQQLLLDSEVLDFGDLINYTLKLFRKRPYILKKYQQQFKYILVDEFQDTNFAQYELIKLLVGEQANLMVVGDDDQSIYKFRGASVSNILQFKNDYPQSAEIYLNKNYRSGQNILDIAYNFIQLNNPERLEVKLKNSKKLSKKLISQIENKGVITHLHGADQNEEVELVVNKIIELKNKNKNSSWNDFAILVRANNQADNFLHGLSYAGVPFNYIASKGLYSKEIVRDILAYLKLLDNYHESMALWRILHLKQIGIRLEDLMQITRLAQRKSYSLYEAIHQLSWLKNINVETKKKIDYIIKKIKEHSSLAQTKHIKEIVLKFLEDFKYNEYLLEQHDEKSFSYLRQFIKKIDDYEKKTNERSVDGFIQLINLEMDSGEQGDLPKDVEEGPEAVKVMTVHAAKGLEFRYVFVVSLVDKRFPSIERREPIDLPDALIKEIIPSGDIHLQEERRLFYVAMTRAKEGLYLSSADNYGGKTKKKLSRFLYEIGLENKKEEKLNDTKVSNTQFLTSKQASIQAVEIKYELPKSFSFSQLKAFESCPYQYYLSFILKIPVKGKAVFSYGKTMHATLQKFMALIKEYSLSNQGNLFGNNIKNKESKTINKKLPSLEKLLEIYQEVWIDDWYESKSNKEKYKKQGEKSLREFYKQIKENPPKVLELEKGFNFKINGYSIRGVIDRIDQSDDNKIEIIDYKTGGAKTIKNIDKDQLLIYQLAAREVFDREVAKLTFYYLNNNSTVSFLGSDKELEKIKDKITDLIEKMKKFDFTATPDKRKCQFCDFKDICEYSKS